MTQEQKIAIFDYWFEWHGHWMFGVYGKEKARKVWQTCGIEGLPDYY